MPRTEVIERKIFKFAELSPRAKERARQWWRDGFDDDLVDLNSDDFGTIAGILGIEFDYDYHDTVGGQRRGSPRILYSGFSCQGDGACFEGRYTYAKGAPKAIRAYAPKDERLHAIADALQAAQRPHFYKLEARVKHSGHYYHEYCTDIEVTDGDDYGSRDLTEASKAITEALRDFMRWIYRQLEADYEYQMSDESVDESIECNEYEFDEEGKRV
jgi:hypothetical protein